MAWATSEWWFWNWRIIWKRALDKPKPYFFYFYVLYKYKINLCMIYNKIYSSRPCTQVTRKWTLRLCYGCWSIEELNYAGLISLKTSGSMRSNKLIDVAIKQNADYFNYIIWLECSRSWISFTIKNKKRDPQIAWRGACQSSCWFKKYVVMCGGNTLIQISTKKPLDELTY